VLAVTDDQAGSTIYVDIFANAQNIFITGGTFIVSLCCSCVCGFSTNSMNRIFTLIILVEWRKKPYNSKANSSPIFTGRQDVLDKLEKIFTHQVTSD